MSSLTDEIKKERERFVAFSFAAAEIFFEIDANDIIVFEGGAVDRIGNDRNGKTHVGTPISDIIHKDDREVFRALQFHLEHKGRLGPIPLRFISSTDNDHALRLFALHMPGKHSRTFLALRSAPLGSGSVIGEHDRETGLMTKESFIALTARTMSKNTQSNNLYLTAIEVDGLDEAKNKHGPKFAYNLVARMAAHLKTISVDGEMAGQIGEKHFAFLHRTQNDGSYIGENLSTLDENVSLKTSVSTMTSDGEDISEEQILRTLTYVLRQFCENSSAVNFDTLSTSYEAMICQAQQRVSNMRSTIESGSFKIAFQPIIKLETGEVHHNEVLSRFDDQMDKNTPLEIIKFAEDVGMIEEFDIALCKKVIDYVRKMRKLGESVTLAVNISGRTLDSDRFVNEFTNVLTEAKDVSRSILLELTETSAINNLDKTEAILNNLKGMKYRICLDDFGTGASGYQYLRAFNVDFVKIDGAYVRNMGQSDYKPAFLLSIVRLCKDLKIKTIGKHVENQFQTDFLKSLGVGYGQGYHFGKPEFTPRT